MRLPEGIVVNAEMTFGNLKFSALHRETYDRDEEGNNTGELLRRTYDLKSEAQGMMIQVILPPEAGEKTFDYNTPVKLVDPFISTVSNATFGGRAETGWYIKAADIIAVSDEKAGGDTPKPGAVPASASASQAKKG